MDKQPQISFALKEIVTDQFAVFEDDFVPKKDINIKTTLEYKLNPKEFLVGVFMPIEFSQKKTIVKFEGHCGFVLTEASWNEFVKDGILTLPKEFIQHLSRVTVGAMRGILHVRLERTALNNVLLPLLDVTKYVESDLQVDLNQ